jgi:adenylate cyclase
VRDDYRTVFSQPSGLDISGVEIAATGFANLLAGRPLTPPAPPVQLAIVAVWGLVVGVGCRLLRPTRAAALALVLAIAYGAAAYERFVDAAIWRPSFRWACSFPRRCSLA